MRHLFAGSIVALAFAAYACSADKVDNSPTDTTDVDAPQDASVAIVDAAQDATEVDAATVDAGCEANPIADKNCSVTGRRAYLCPGDAGQHACDFFAGLGDVSLYCCER